MNTATVVSLTVTLIVAVGGYVAKYVNDLRIHQRQGRLNRIERQLSELYGPLLALSYAGRVGWDAAVDDIRPHGLSFGEQDFSEEEFETFDYG